MKWRPVDIIVLILTIIIGISVWFAQVKPLFSDAILSADILKAITHIDGAMIAIISMYVGSKLGGKINKSDEG